uniref:HTH_48 domain-containing protein n=1 Tax=Strongyloides papillosus TaxID=174720 RepID=A0A0N5CCE7_STREA
MLSKRDIRSIMLYEFKRRTYVAKTTQDINKTFGEDLVSHATVKRWFKKFREGSEDLENEERGRPDTVLDNDELRKAVEANPRVTIRELAGELNVSKTTVSNHLKEIGKTKELDKWVPHELNYYQKLYRYEDEVPKHFPKPKLTPKKVMVTVWWSAVRVIHYKFMEPGETINSESYFNRKGPILLHDNAKPHVSKMTLQKLCELGYEILPHPPYSPDLSPTDHHFFKHLNNFLTEKVFRNDEDIKTAFEAFIESRSPDFYVNGINNLVSRWQQCADSNGCYFE